MDGDQIPGTDEWYLGSSYDQIFDVNGDKIGDLVVCHDRTVEGDGLDWNVVTPWQVLCISGADGSVLWSWVAPCSEFQLGPGEVQSWLDLDEDGASEVLCRWAFMLKSGDRRWDSIILSGKTGEPVGQLPDDFEGRDVRLAVGTSVGLRGTESSGGIALQLERQEFLEDEKSWVPLEYSAGKTWGRIQVFSIGRSSVEAVALIEPPAGQAFVSAPAWIQETANGRIWGVACLCRSARETLPKLRLAKMSQESGGQIEWSWLGISDVEFSDSSTLDAAVVGDQDSDGVPDLAIGASSRPYPRTPSKVVVLSGKSGRRLLTLLDHGEDVESFGCSGPDSLGCGFGCSIAVGDFDADGSAEIVIGSDLANMSSGMAIVYDLRSGTAAPLPGSWVGRYGHYGDRVESGVDYDKDGIPDILVGESWHNLQGHGGPWLFVYSGRTLDLIRRFPPSSKKWLDK